MAVMCTHPLWAETSLPLTLPEVNCNATLTYQIISRVGQIIRQGSFRGGYVYISTRMLPKGQQFLLRIVCNDDVLHEGHFETLRES